MTSVVESKAGSHFAALLRRSKFASYDPKIGQVYYSYDGDAHRGNFGLKRPLPLRRRKAYITIGAVDSKEQQTEWKHADNEARWMKMWDEVGVHPDNGQDAPWTTRLNPPGGCTVDSEFAPLNTERLATGNIASSYGGQSSAVPNIYAMSPTQFKVYIGRLRKLRPAFKQYVREHPDGNPETNLWRRTTRPGLTHEKFLKNQAYESYTNPDSRVIEQQPARSAGLSYTKTSLLQSMLYTKSHRGRILQSGDASGDLIAGYAGMNVHVPFALKHNSTPVNWNSLAIRGEFWPTQGLAEFRYVKTVLRDAPNVVGPEPQGIEGLRMDAYVMDVHNAAIKQHRQNSHKPGSRAYVAQGSQRSTPQPANLLRAMPRASEQLPEERPADNLAVLATLRGFLDKSSPL